MSNRLGGQGREERGEKAEIWPALKRGHDNRKSGPERETLHREHRGG